MRSKNTGVDSRDSQRHQYLSLAYRLVPAGKKWQFPEEISGAYKEKDIMEQAKNVGQKLIDSALGELKAGQIFAQEVSKC